MSRPESLEQRLRGIGNAGYVVLFEIQDARTVTFPSFFDLSHSQL